MSTLRDKVDNTRGLQESTPIKQITTYQNIVQIDTRDCVGTESLASARAAFEKNGGRKEASGIITSTTGIGVYPITIFTIILNDVLKNGDFVKITGVQGNTICNNTWKIFNVTAVSFDINGISSGNYAGGGQWLRQSDNGYPTITDTTCTISGNEMIIMLQKKLKVIRSVALNVGIIPRDIIPIISYYKDLYYVDLDPSIYETFIIPEEKLMKDQSFGFYSTNLSIFRSYSGKFAMSNQITPPPLNLWNPPVGVWPNQPIPYPYQTVPTYKSNIIIVNSKECFLICSGYGVYDLKDWTLLTRTETEIARKKLLSLIIRPQSCKDVNYITIINNCSTTSNNISPFGYGDFQRFLCGPGIQLNYQPGSSDAVLPTVIGPDNPIAFPNFRGNVWGPYDTPGDRFQRLGLRDTIQDLFLNGDLDNIFGLPIIKPDIQASDIPSDPNYGLIDTSLLTGANFGTVSTATSPNILNAMRIVSNGFGATSVVADGGGLYTTTSILASSGGIGPSTLGAPSAWSLTGIYGAPTLADPNAVGPLSWNLLTNGTIPQTAVGNLPNNYPAQTAGISHRFGWYDTGPNQGTFRNEIRSYLLYSTLNVPSTNLVIQAFQFPRNERSQSTNSVVGSSIFNVPIRLLPGTNLDGSFEYVEGLYGLITQSSDLEYWGQRFISPLASLSKINLQFYTYEGIPIPLEKQLSYINYNNNDSTSSLIRSKRFISLLFRIETYQYATPGLNDIIDRILGSETTEEDEFDPFFSDNVIKASNYY